MKDTTKKKASIINQEEAEGSKLPLLLIPDLVVFPEIVTSTFIERGDETISVLENLMGESNYLLLGTNKNPNKTTKLTSKDIYPIGTLVEVLQVLSFPGMVKMLLKGVSRVKLSGISHPKGFPDAWQASYQVIESSVDFSNESFSELKNITHKLLTEYSASNKKISASLINDLQKIEDTSSVIDNIATHLPITTVAKYKVLSEADVLKRLALVNSLIEVELSLVGVEKKLRSQVKKQIEKNQKEYYLNEQLKAIYRELNGSEAEGEEGETLRKKIKALKVEKSVKEKLLQDAKKLSNMSPVSAEASVLRGYLELICALPWGIETPCSINLNSAQEVLDKEHYGLQKVKERIIEYLAVLQKSNCKTTKAPILCLIGAPGVGKTSLARSIAKSAGREFVRIALGGLKDESEIRGHRRTYIGAMPGRIIQALKKLKTSNPVILLDEIDKISSDFRGDPASALLEVLDPEQNHGFVDNYVELEFDLSNVMFIATANSFNMHEALLDRMEILELSGYTEEEKVTIAKKHLIANNMEQSALDSSEFEIEDDVLVSLVRHYTRESGVRQLDREVANLTRKAVKEILQSKKADRKKIIITCENLPKYAGPYKFTSNFNEGKDRIGVVTGLAWTKTGGETLYIETLKTPGKGGIKITGKLGDVMKESVQAARSWVYSTCPPEFVKQLQDHDIHVHVPEGAVPKDGPSAGVAMVTALVSLVSGIKVRHDIAMTGEITLRGQVLPIGGLKEKLLAALRFGIKEAIIPKQNEKDLLDIPPVVIENVKITPVSTIQEVLSSALVDKIDLQAY